MVDQQVADGQPAALAIDAEAVDSFLRTFFVQHEGQLIPMERADLESVKSVKFSLAEVALLDQFQEYLAITVNPHTGQTYIPRNEFGQMMLFCLNFTCAWVGEFARQMAAAEGGET